MSADVSRRTPGTGQAARATRWRIMDAVLDVLRDTRLRDLTLEDVAANAAVSRQTVYRHFGSRDGLLREVVLREERRLAERAREAVEGIPTLAAAVTAAVTALLEGVREHPLIDRLIADDPEILVPLLTLGRGPVLSTSVEIVAELVGRYVSDGDDLVEPDGDHRVGDVADVLSRLVISYTIAPGGRSPADIGQLGARLVCDGLVEPRG